MKCPVEKDRLAFMEQRDGKEEAMFFARQVVVQYVPHLTLALGKSIV